MTLVVPFDGSQLAETALVRAGEFGVVFDEGVVAMTVIRANNADYAREHDWLGPDESFDIQTIVERLTERVNELAPNADFRYEVVGRYTSQGGIGNSLRRLAREEGASMVFIGSENAGNIVSSVSSVGSTVAAGDFYDVVIVRHAQPARIEKLRDAHPAASDLSEPTRTE